MKNFEDWVKTFPKCSEKLLELGASWDSFRREPDEVISDLVKSGIPILSAKDIVDKARIVLKQKSAPMAIFWDLESISLPASCTSSRQTTENIRYALSCYGTLNRCKGYSVCNSSTLTSQQRTGIVEAGCLVLDSQNKEMITKRIIVDAMSFAYEHPEGATLCFVSGDSDLSFLFEALERPQWVTVLLSFESVLQHVSDISCNYKLVWSDGGIMNEDLKQSGKGTVNTSEIVESVKKNIVKKLTPADVVLLRTQIEASAIDLGNEQLHSALKSRVGSLLRVADPARFPTRDDLTIFLDHAIADGLVVETGYGEYKMLTICGLDGSLPTPPLEIKKITPPLTNADLPKKIIDLSKTKPYIILVPWSECVNRETFPKKAFVHTSKKWAMLMFENLIHAQQAAVEFPWLRSGDLIDWRRVGNDRFQSSSKQPPTTTTTTTSSSGVTNSDGTSNSNTKSSTVSDNYQNRSEKGSNNRDQQQRYTNQNTATAAPYEQQQQRTYSDAARKPYEPKKRIIPDANVQCVVSVMEMLLESDELYVAEPVLRYQLATERGGEANDAQYYAWIENAVKSRSIIQFRRPGVPKARFYCLPWQLQNSIAACNPDDIDTSVEENHVVNLIKNSTFPWITRVQVIKNLVENFERMVSPAMRVRLFQNAARKNLFFVAKDGCTQVVGLTKEDAYASLKNAQSSKNGTTTTTSSS